MRRNDENTMNIIFYGLCIILVMFLLGTQVEAKQITIHEITESTTLCTLLEDGDTVVLRSNGGSVQAAWAIVDCIRSKYVNIRVERAFSAATFIALAGREVCITRHARLGFHSPYSVNILTGEMINLSVQRLRSISRMTYYRMLDQGYSKQVALYIIGLTFMTPSESISVLRFDAIKDILGHRFTGECND
jgi:ATP-dependent protease ClpP protease subunit